MATFHLNTLDEFLLKQIVNKLTFRSGANFYRSCRGAKALVDAVKPAWLPPDQRYLILLEHSMSRYAGPLVLLDMKTFDWKCLSIAMPYEANVPGIVFLNGELYVFGGAYRSDLKVAYKLKKNLEWERLPDMNKRRSNIGRSSVIFNGCIWVLGGACTRSFTPTRTVEAYDPTSNTWIEKPSMNRRRRLHAAAVVNGKIFVCGGDIDRRPTATVEYYDAELSRWIDCPPLPGRDGYSRACVYGSYLIITGSSYFDEVLEKHNSHVWCMDVEEANPRWRNLPSSTTWSLSCAATVGGKLVVAGLGLNTFDLMLSVEIFDGKTWSSGPDLPGLEAITNLPSTSISDNFAEKLLEQ